MLVYKKLIFSLTGHCDNNVAFQKKSPLPAHVGVRAAGELDFFNYFGNLHHAYAIGNAQPHAGMFRKAYIKDHAELRFQDLS